MICGLFYDFSYEIFFCCIQKGKENEMSCTICTRQKCFTYISLAGLILYGVCVLMYNGNYPPANTVVSHRTSSEDNDNVDYEMDYDNLIRAITLDHDYNYFMNNPYDEPKPQEKFSGVPKMDVFSGSNSPCRSISKHYPKILNSCNGKKSCCRKVQFVGMCGKWASVLRKFPYVVNCPKCTVVVDHVAQPRLISEADLVVFTHIGGYMSLSVWEDLLSYKHTNQRWVFSTIESAIYVRGLLPPWNLRNEVYDYTETFMSQSNITTPYGFYQSFRIGEPKLSWNYSEHLKNKDKLISWTASHCETLQWDRKKFAEDLGKVLPGLDTYGKCGKKSICKNIWDANCSKQFDELMATYKFLLSLENSCCNQYITEKFWKTLEHGIVPVVVGPPIEDLMNLAPPKSFIHADQFQSMKELADYLLYLDKNDTAYSEYLSWKRKGQVFQDTTPNHYKRIVSDEMICKLVGLREKEMDQIKMGVNQTRRHFDPYSSAWEGTCVTCGKHDWLKRYEFPPEHKRKSKSLWT